MERRKSSRKPLNSVRFQLEGLETRDLPTAASLLALPIASVRTGASAVSSASTPGVPTRHELARQRFLATFSGSFTTGPGRYTDQASQTWITGGGNATAFLHGDVQMAFYTPVDSSGQIIGQAALIVKNVGNTGNLLGLNLVGDPTSLDRAGRPKHFTWTVSDLSGGSFSGATGAGTLDILYKPGTRLPKRATSAGSVGVVFRGLIDTSDVTNILRT